MPILDHLRRLMRPAALTREIATPSITGVRQVLSGHPAAGITSGSLASILRAAEDGDPTSYLELAEDIEERDLHYQGVLGTRKRAVSQLEITVEAAADVESAVGPAMEIPAPARRMADMQRAVGPAIDLVAARAAAPGAGARRAVCGRRSGPRVITRKRRG
jgi:hypothetical protein